MTASHIIAAAAEVVRDCPALLADLREDLGCELFDPRLTIADWRKDAETEETQTSRIVARTFVNWPDGRLATFAEQAAAYDRFRNSGPYYSLPWSELRRLDFEQLSAQLDPEYLAERAAWAAELDASGTLPF